MPSFALGRELAGLKGLLGRATGALAMPSIFTQGKPGSLLEKSLNSIPSTRKTDAGRALGNTLSNELQYMGSQLKRGSLPYLGNEMRHVTEELSQGRNPYGTPLNAIETGKYGPTDWNPSANPRRVPTTPVPFSGAADRAYQSAKAETAAMVATDPLMQQWSAAQKAKDFATADLLGKQIWQNKYGGGLMGQPGGAIGATNPLMRSTFGYQTGMSPGDIAKTITNPADIPVSPGEAPYQTGDFGTRLGENGYDATKYGITPEMIEEIRKRQGVEEMKNRLLQQAAAK